MSDGAQEAKEDLPQHRLCIKTWARTLPQSLNESYPHDQADIGEQYTRYLTQLESGDGLKKHYADFLVVSRATTIADFRWFSSASWLPNAEIARYILTRRSEFAGQREIEEDVFDLALLQDFHAASAPADKETVSRLGRSFMTGRKPLHVYGRKSTATRRQSTPRKPLDTRLNAFRRIMQSSNSSQEEKSSHESIQASTPRKSGKRKTPLFDSPAVASAFVQSSEASSPSPPTVQSKTNLIREEVKRVKVVRELKGRQPLSLQMTTAALPLDPAWLRHPHTSARAKKTPAMRPITRKIPANGIPLHQELPQMQKTVGKVFSHARRLQAFGGSWPLKGKNSESATGAELQPGIGDSTEIIEDYTIHLDASSSPPESLNIDTAPRQVTPPNARVGTRLVTNASAQTFNNVTSSSEEHSGLVDTFAKDHKNLPTAASASIARLDTDGTAGTFVSASSRDLQMHHKAFNSKFTSVGGRTTDSALDGPTRSTNLPDPPSPLNPGFELDYHLLRNRQDHETLHEGGNDIPPSPPCAQMPALWMGVPDISVTLPTSSVNSSSGQRASSLETPDREGLGDGSAKATVASNRIVMQKPSESVTMAQFLSLAFGSDTAAPTAPLCRHILPSRCFPAFRRLSKAIIPSTIAEILVPPSSLYEGGLFGCGYLGRGRRGFWQLPLNNGQMHQLQASQGIVLGTSPSTHGLNIHPSTIVWTLQRLRYLIHRLQDLARLGKFGVVTVATIGEKGREAIEVCCQASMALMLRSVLSELRCPLDTEGNEVCLVSDNEGSGKHKGQGSDWLGTDNVKLVWWDEVERRPVLIS